MVRASVKKVCRNCRIIRRNGRVRVICSIRTSAPRLIILGVVISLKSINFAPYIFANRALPVYEFGELGMACIAGVNIPDNKHSDFIAVCFGIGQTRAKAICKATGIGESAKIASLSASVEMLRTGW